MQTYSINPNNEVVRALIREYVSGMVTTIYGNSASGKTTACLLAAALVSKSNKVIYIDTGRGFNTERFYQLCSDIKRLANIFLIQPKSFEDQHRIILNTKKLCTNPKIRLVIVDTIGNFYRKALASDPEKVNQCYLEQMQTLVRIARDLNKVVLITNQVYNDMEDNLRMIGGKYSERLSRCIIEFRKNKTRTATCVKYKTADNTTFYNLNKSLKFEIREKGLFLIKNL